MEGRTSIQALNLARGRIVRGISANNLVDRSRASSDRLDGEEGDHHPAEVKAAASNRVISVPSTRWARTALRPAIVNLDTSSGGVAVFRGRDRGGS